MQNSLIKNTDKFIDKSNLRDKFPKVGFLSGIDLKEFSQLINYKINYVGFFEQALTHKSYLQVLKDKKYKSNERLEFLGDALLGLIIGEYLFFSNVDDLEGDLTKVRANYISKNSLALCAKKLKLEKYLQMSYSAQNSLASGGVSILADAIESIIAAIYLDSSFTNAKKFVIEILVPIIKKNRDVEEINHKSLLLEISQYVGKGTPYYKVLSDSGPDHNKLFVIGVYVNEELLYSGKGKSKKEAEQNAAKKALSLPIFKKGLKQYGKTNI